MFLFDFIFAVIILTTMLIVSEEEIHKRFSTDNPWWKNSNHIRWKDAPERVYLNPFYELVNNEKINRAVVLMGPRRVGKTVMVHQAVAKLVSGGVKPERVLYVPLDNPLYLGLSLEEILLMFVKLNKIGQNEHAYLFFDEIQYLKDWEKHLKSLVDSYPQHRFVATGSAAAALKLKSDESGAGRFTDFTLPPLTFYEYIKFLDKEKKFFIMDSFNVEKIEDFNEEFLGYINFGGYPEAVFSEEIRNDPSRFIRNDIIDKVLLRDLPSLYGVSDIRELNRLFMMLAHNTGQEIDLQGLSQDSNLAKGTISRYLEYLEAAFLIRRIRRVDKNAKKFKREYKFKIYLTNASMYSALFGMVDKENTPVLGKLAETAIFSHFFHLEKYIREPYYARWKNGEVDLVIMDSAGIRPAEAIEIKWSNKPVENPSKIKGLLGFGRKHGIADPGALTCCTLSQFVSRTYKDISVLFFPVSLTCFSLGKSLTSNEFRETLVKSANELERQ